MDSFTDLQEKDEHEMRKRKNTLERKDTIDRVMDEVIFEPNHSEFKSAEEWDNIVVPSAEHPVAESFIIPIDEPDGKLKASTNKAANTFAAKKTVAQGMMDIALITANANQLRYIIEFNNQSKTYYLNLVLIVISLVIQVAVGVCLIFKGNFDMKGESKLNHARKMNNYVVVGVFLVTIINVFIASFTITGNSIPAPNVLPAQNSN